jgi:hypothetical protein
MISLSLLERSRQNAVIGRIACIRLFERYNMKEILPLPSCVLSLDRVDNSRNVVLHDTHNGNLVEVRTVLPLGI